MSVAYRDEDRAEVLNNAMLDSDEADWYADRDNHRALARARAELDGAGLRAAVIRLPVTPLWAAILAYQEEQQ